MAGRAAAPLPRSARSQPPALGAPLSLLLSPAHGGGSSLLGSPAPVIRGAGLGGRSPRPPPRDTPGGECYSSPSLGSLSPTSSETEEGTLTRQSRSCSSGRERRGVPVTHNLWSHRGICHTCAKSLPCKGQRTLGFSWTGHSKPLLAVSFGLSFPPRMGKHGCSE